MPHATLQPPAVVSDADADRRRLPPQRVMEMLGVGKDYEMVKIKRPDPTEHLYRDDEEES